MTDKRSYVALASDGDMIDDVSRAEALEWADEHLSMLEHLQPNDSGHWVQVMSYEHYHE